MLHGVLDGPQLTGAGLQDQLVAEVNAGRHHLQAPARGSVHDGVVLQGEEQQNCQVLQGFISFCLALNTESNMIRLSAETEEVLMSRRYIKPFSSFY